MTRSPMELSAEQRQRIYLEEKARLEARKQLRRPLVHGVIIAGCGIVAILVCLFMLGKYHEAEIQRLLTVPDIRGAYTEVQAEIGRTPAVVAAGGPQSITRTDTGWKFELPSRYRDADTGLVVDQMLVAYADRSNSQDSLDSGWRIRLRKP